MDPCAVHVSEHVGRMEADTWQPGIFSRSANRELRVQMKSHYSALYSQSDTTMNSGIHRRVHLSHGQAIFGQAAGNVQEGGKSEMM